MECPDTQHVRAALARLREVAAKSYGYVFCTMPVRTNQSGLCESAIVEAQRLAFAVVVAQHERRCSSNESSSQLKAASTCTQAKPRNKRKRNAMCATHLSPTPPLLGSVTI